ncbi:MAG TPA: DUF2784 domain-containing protein, partial [Azonexus sp.]|nr:DUF2784 domain-containing protein [Azonexus sp.]
DPGSASRMIYHTLANAVLVLHLAFIVFVVLGAALSWRFPRLRWLHFVALAWAAFIEFSGGICPLTPLENRLRRMAGGEGYGGGFIAHYLMPIIYPQGLTREWQMVLGVAVIVINLAAYAAIHYAGRRRESGA